MFKRYSYYYAFILSVVLGCGDPAPIPQPETYRNNKEEKPSPLSAAWREKLALVDAQPGQKELIDNLIELKPENRDALLEIIDIIPSQELEAIFLRDFIVFTKEQQAHLINILLYLESRDKNLILKLFGPKQLSLFENIKMLKLLHEIDQEGRNLIEAFEKKFEQDIAEEGLA